jgi:prolyl oligopeptidase
VTKTDPAVGAHCDFADVEHAEDVADPYRTLEDGSRPDVQDWLRSQGQKTRRFLDALPGRDRIERMLLSASSTTRWGVPIRRAGKSFYTVQHGDAQQQVWMVADKAGERILVDPHSWRGQDTDYVGAFEPSPDARYVAYVRHLSGSGFGTLHIFDVERGCDLPEVIGRCRLAFPSWAADSRRFLYTRSSEELPSASAWDEIVMHRVGDTVDCDQALSLRWDPSLRFGWTKSLPDRSGFVCYRNGGGSRHAVWILDENGAEVVQIADANEFDLSVVHKTGSTIFALTDYMATRMRVVAFDLSAPQPDNWRTVIPESSCVIKWVTFVGGSWVLCRSEHGWDRVEVQDADGGPLRRVPLPEPAILSWPQSTPDDDDLDLAVYSLAHQGTIYRITPRLAAAHPVRSLKGDHGLSDCVLAQVFVTARDGERIPLTLIHPPGLVRDGRAPTLLYGYGAFGRPAAHGFSFATLAWLKSGGVYAIAHTRGGSEEGENWHEAAKGAKRSVAHQDFCDCAEWLIAERYCSADMLGIRGASAGGLLVATAFLQRPDLFGAAICDAAPTDMVRFPKFTLGSAWIDEFGDPGDPAALQVILQWSPLHNVQSDRSYPPILISTGARDEVVAPLHSMKFAAALQNTPSPLVLLHVKENAGHSVANSRDQRRQLVVDQHVFLWSCLAKAGQSSG